jgi:putative transcriptional regulator
MTVRLRQIRREKGMSQEELAKKSGVTRQTIIRIERNECKEMRVSTLLLLCNALKCDVSDFLCP